MEAAHERDPDVLRASLRAGTLVICPLIALLQWQSEIARFTAPGALKVRLSFTLMMPGPPDRRHCLLFVLTRSSSTTGRTERAWRRSSGR